MRVGVSTRAPRWGMGRLRISTYHWVFYVAAGLLYAGTLFRTPLSVEGSGTLAAALALLAAWLILFVVEVIVLPGEWPWTVAYLAAQTFIVGVLLLLPGSYDFFGVLLGPLAMQATMRHGPRWGAPVLAAFAAVLALTLLQKWSPSVTAVFVVLYTVLAGILSLYAVATRRTAEARAANEGLAERLLTINEQLSASSSKLERAAVTRERNRVARELHDSVTQTIFSMTLSGQSAILLQDRPDKVRAQLDRMTELARSALAEMHDLILQLTPEATGEGGLPAALRQEVERRAADGLRITLTVDEPPVGGGATLGAAEEQNLLRIAQEALNNVAKHSGAGEADIRLRLWAPARLEIEDRGTGFGPEGFGPPQGAGAPETASAGGVGVSSMRERATEIGWRLEIHSTPGEGTRVVVREPVTQDPAAKETGQ